MTIQITNPGSPAFYKETVNVTAQYANLLKKPEGKIQNKFAQAVVYLVISLFLLAFGIVSGFLWGFDALRYMLIVISAFLMLTSAFLLFTYHKARRTLMKNWKPGTLTLDDGGVQFSKGDDTLRTAWENVAFVRVLAHGICFVAKEPMQYVLHIEKAHADEIVSYLAQNKPEIRLITR